MNDTPRGSWASSIFDLKQSQADVLLPKNLLRKKCFSRFLENICLLIEQDHQHPDDNSQEYDW
jgi:hypothetical protein